MATPQQQTSAPDTLPADFFASGTAAPDTLPANYFSSQAAPATLPADFFSKAPAQPAHDPNARFFTGEQGQVSAAPEPSVWDRIKSAADAYASRAGSFLEAAATGKSGGEAVPDRAMPALAVAKRYAVDPFNRAAQAGSDFGRQAGRDVVTGGTLLQHGGDYLNATLPSPYGPKPNIESPEKMAEREHPYLMGAAGGAGSIVGGTVADPRNWPFFASGVARPALQKLIARGFSTQMAVQTFQGAKELYDHWDQLTPEERAEIGTKTGVGALFLTKGLTESVGKKAPETPTHVQEISVSPASPLGQVLEEPAQAPHVRVVNSSAAARDLLERDTILRPVAEVPSNINDPALEAVEAQTKGRAAEVAKKYPVTPVPPDAEARVTGPSNVAAFRLPAARVVSDGYVPIISKDAVLSQAVQNIVNNSDALRQAGVDPASIKTHGDIQAALQIASDHVASNLDPRAAAVITLEGQRQLADDLNMNVEDLLARRQGQSFNAEELVAARALLKASNDAVIAAAKDAAASGDLDEFTRALSTHKALQEQIAGVRAEAGRALGSFRVGEQDLPQTKIADVLAKLPDKVRAQAARLISRLDPTDPASVRQVNQFVEQIKPSTTVDKLFEYYRNSLLSSPHTLIVKTASEAAMAALETAKKAVASGISKDRFAAEPWYYAKGMAQAIAEHARPILTGAFQLEGSPGFEKAGTQAIKGPIGSVVRAPSEAMSRMTNLMYAGNYFGEINALAARQALSEGLNGDEFNARQEYLAHHPTAEMSEAAHGLATRNTFQSRLGPFAEKLGQAIATKPDAAWLPESAKGVSPLQFLFPFYRTPINLLKASITHLSPYELLNGLAKGDVDATARGLVGSSIAASLAALALSGHITGGGPSSFSKEETLRSTGWSPYSLKIGDKYYSYRRFEPVGFVAGLIADAVHGEMTGDSEVVTQSKADTAVKHIMRNLDDMPFMGTLANLLQAVHDPIGGRAQSFVNREAGSLVPAGVANVAEGLDRTIRRPTTAMQAIQSRIPGLTQAAPPIVDITGHTVQRPASNLGGANPFPFTTAKNDPVVTELARLGISTPQPPTQIKWRDKPTQLTDAERQAFAEAEGQQLYRRASRLISSSSWQRLSDDKKRKQLVDVHREIDEDRPARLTRLRRDAKTELSRRSLLLPTSAP